MYSPGQVVARAVIDLCYIRANQDYAGICRNGVKIAFDNITIFMRAENIVGVRPILEL